MTYGPYWPASELTPAQSRAERIDKIIDEVRTANAEAVFDFSQRKQGRG